MTNPAPSPIDLISAAQVVEDQAQSLREAMETAKHWLTANTQLDASMRFVRAYSILNQALEGRLGDLDQLSKDLRESAPPEPAGRPLQAVLADIVAEGHVFILSSTTDSCTLSTWLKGVDNLKSESEYSSASPALVELPAAAEARLAQIREMHTAAVAELDESSEEEGLVWDRNEYRETTTAGPEEVDTEHEALAAEEARRTAEASERLENAIDAADGVIDPEEGA